MNEPQVTMERLALLLTVVLLLAVVFGMAMALATFLQQILVDALPRMGEYG